MVTGCNDCEDRVEKKKKERQKQRKREREKERESLFVFDIAPSTNRASRSRRFFDDDDEEEEERRSQVGDRVNVVERSRNTFKKRRFVSHVTEAYTVID